VYEVSIAASRYRAKRMCDSGPGPICRLSAYARASRLIRLGRVDFEELVDDVPGLAAAVCRALGERARRAQDSAYRSPLASRV